MAFSTFLVRVWMQCGCARESSLVLCNNGEDEVDLASYSRHIELRIGPPSDPERGCILPKYPNSEEKDASHLSLFTAPQETPSPYSAATIPPHAPQPTHTILP